MTTEFERLRGVFEGLAVKHTRQYLQDRDGNELQIAEKYYAVARDLPIQLVQRAGNQITYDSFRRLLEDATTSKEIADAMGWTSNGPPASPKTGGVGRSSPDPSRQPAETHRP